MPTFVYTPQEPTINKKEPKKTKESDIILETRINRFNRRNKVEKRREERFRNSRRGVSVRNEGV